MMWVHATLWYVVAAMGHLVLTPLGNVLHHGDLIGVGKSHHDSSHGDQLACSNREVSLSLIATPDLSFGQWCHLNERTPVLTTRRRGKTCIPAVVVQVGWSIVYSFGDSLQNRIPCSIVPVVRSLHRWLFADVAVLN